MSEPAPAPTRPRGVRCPSCGARVTAAASWCSLCFADLAPPAAPVSDLVPRSDLAPVQDGGPADTSAPPPEPPASSDVEQLAQRLIAELAVTTAAPVRPGLGFLSTTAGRVAAMLLGTVLVSLLGFGVLALGGALL